MVTVFVQTWKIARYMVEASLMATVAMLALVVVLWLVTGMTALVGGWETAAPIMLGTVLAAGMSLLFLISVPVNLAIMFVSGSVARSLTK
jgi:hypothetical protein